MNQARSAFGQALIAKIHPGVAISSCGVEAFEGVGYLEDVVSVAHRWSVHMNSGFSRKLSAFAADNIDLVICAEESMMQSVIDCGYSGEILSYEEIVPDTSFMPKDPAGLQGRFLETELAKVAWIHLGGLSAKLGGSKVHSVTAVIPERDGLLDSALDFAIAECARTGARLVDADLRAPIVRELRAREINVRKFSQLEDFVVGDAFSAMTENMWPEKSFIDPAWQNLIESYAQDRPVVMITSPQVLASGPLPDSYLAAIPSTVVKVVQS